MRFVNLKFIFLKGRKKKDNEDNEKRTDDKTVSIILSV